MSVDTSNPHSLAAGAEVGEARETFTILLLANGRQGEPMQEVTARNWTGVVVAADGDVIFSTGLVGPREKAWSQVRDFLVDWRLRGYVA